MKDTQERKEKLISLINNEEYKPMRAQDIAFLLNLNVEEKAALDEIIKELDSEGRILVTKRGKIMPIEKENLIRGTFVSHAKGFGFVVPDSESERDIFIPADYVNSAMNKDTVLCKIIELSGNGRRAEGEIVKIISRGMNTIVGTFTRHQNNAFVIPDDKKIPVDIYIPKANGKSVVNGHKVVVKITKPAGEGRKNPEGKIIEILGHINEPGVDILSIIKQFEIPTEFGEKVIDEARETPQTISESEISGRMDLRGETIVTIDSDDALDLDDGISIEKTSQGYKLGVHIADVNHYVTEGSALDKEALRRGTSVYLADRVIPMLPVELSNGICSLNAGEDRLALSCIMDLDLNGNVKSHVIAETIIHVSKRCSYKKVDEALEGNIAEDYKAFLPMLETMAELAAIFKKNRISRGSIEFDFPESKIILDEDGKPVDIVLRERGVSSKVIEEFMLICNETVAQEYYWLEAPFVYRSHETPDSEKLDALTEFLRHFGYSFRGKASHPKNIQKLLDYFKGKAEEPIVSKMTLRSMKQARYTKENIGHFGLAAKYYCHFTSPIRRYPDLQIHRIIKDNLNGKLSSKASKYEKILPDVCKHSSLTERTAEEAEREVENLKKVQFMEDKVGEEFDAIISSVTNFGLFVELENFIEGMISLADMEDDYYFFDERNMQVIGERLGKIYKLGQPVKVLLAKADLFNRRLDFVLAEDEE